MPCCRKFLSITIAACAALSVAWAESAPATNTARPTLIELFTSEGCSSCPPAEVVLKDLAAQPGIIALAFHVDYWDSLGWRDRFSMPLATLRQHEYVAALGLSSGFTPQVVVDGRASVLGSDRRRITANLEASQGIELRLGIAAGRLTVTLPAAAMLSGCDVNLIAYLSHASTAVRRGENSGRTLEEFNIVREFRRLGPWQGGAASFDVPLASLPSDADRVAVVVQRSHQGLVEGAATANLRGPME